MVEALRKNLPHAFLDCHLMVSDPTFWIQPLATAGADLFTFHLEAVGSDISKAIEVVEAVRAAGMRVGVALCPETALDLSALAPLVDKVDMMLVMTVRPGFGGQKFMPDMMGKVKALREAYSLLHIQVDGGLAPATIGMAATAGANVIVAGSAVFGAADPGAVITQLRQEVNG